MARSILFQLVAIGVISLIFPLGFAIYGLYAGAGVERLAVEERGRRLQAVLGLVESGLSEIPKEETGEVLDERVKGILKKSLSNYSGVRAGVLLLPSRRVILAGDLDRFDHRPEPWPREDGDFILERNPVVLQALMTGERASGLVAFFKGERLVHAVPVSIANEKAVAWTEEMLQPAFVHNRVMRQWGFILSLLGLSVAFASALYLSGRLARGVNRIQKGLASLKHDLNYRLPPMSGELGQIAAAINQLARGLLERDRLEQQLQRSTRLAALGHLTAGVAHEMRNPLGIIRGTAQLMSQEYSHIPGLAQDVGVILEQVDRQNRVIRELLDFARPSPPQVQTLDLNAVLESVLLFSRKFLQQKQVELITRLDYGIPPVQADGERIKQVFLNLLLNAAEAMPGGGRITIETSGSPGRVVVSFRDTGPGISPADLPHLFDPFFTTKNEGTGLGLAISHQIVTLHGGTIEVEQGNPGAVFRVILPAFEEGRSGGGTLDPGN
ncbi:MAG: ATP-binding protein [Bacillota bacterium]